MGSRDPMYWVCVCAYPTQYTSRMGTARVKQEEEIDKNNVRVVRNLEERNVGTKGKSSKQNLHSAENLTIELPERREFPYHRLN